ncbi:CpsD/CapB family tyrosine-protein kinase [Paenibacillus sp. y28]
MSTRGEGVPGLSSGRISEQYLALRINLDFAIQEQQVKSIAVTSHRRGEGRTTTAMHLAYAYAEAGFNTVLIDADLRTPSLHAAFGWNNRNGLTQILDGSEQLGPILRSAGIERLSVIPSGPVPPNHVELLASRRMDELLEQLKQQFDMVLLDTPPASGYIDAKVIAAKSDGYLLVMEHGKVKRLAARKLKDEFGRLRANLLGVMLNKVNGKKL